MSNNGACPTSCPPFWSGSGSYTARCANEGEMRWGWMPAGTKTISGAVIYSSGSPLKFLVAHDYAPEGALRFSVFEFTEGQMTDNNALPWIGSTPPGNIESLARFDDNTFVAVTGAGELYMMELNQFGSAISATFQETLPFAGDITEDIESFAVREIFGKKLCAWATRGGGGGALIFYGEIAADGVVTSYLADYSDGLAYTAPYPTASSRSIAALYIGPFGELFASAVSDPGDSGPFASAVYRIGEFAAGGPGAILTLDGTPTEIYRSNNHKAEAICAVEEDGHEFGLVLASDDENRGGSIFLEYGPIGRRITIHRTAVSTISQSDAILKARKLAKAEALAELACYSRYSQSVAPYCGGDYYDPITRDAWSDVSESAANDAALNSATDAAKEWCDTEFDQEPPPIINGESTSDLVESLIDESGVRLVDETLTPLQNE